eukprot:TRINITY_DN26918_c0_g1_i1.p1 TRINITY_DN26918_c0_g1~~TRINITY_DN26918_c0_g1_i1.p1  ORF type:complete len:3227 (-),score=628.99 TRINITY_DN26918_c0_g1_i1:167-8533(-)
MDLMGIQAGGPLSGLRHFARASQLEFHADLASGVLSKMRLSQVQLPLHTDVSSSLLLEGEVPAALARVPEIYIDRLSLLIGSDMSIVGVDDGKDSELNHVLIPGLNFKLDSDALLQGQTGGRGPSLKGSLLELPTGDIQEVLKQQVNKALCNEKVTDSVTYSSITAELPLGELDKQPTLTLTLQDVAWDLHSKTAFPMLGNFSLAMDSLRMTLPLASFLETKPIPSQYGGDRQMRKAVMKASGLGLRLPRLHASSTLPLLPGDFEGCLPGLQKQEVPFFANAKELLASSKLLQSRMTSLVFLHKAALQIPADAPSTMAVDGDAYLYVTFTDGEGNSFQGGNFELEVSGPATFVSGGSRRLGDGKRRLQETTSTPVSEQATESLKLDEKFSITGKLVDSEVVKDWAQRVGVKGEGLEHPERRRLREAGDLMQHPVTRRLQETAEQSCTLPEASMVELEPEELFVCTVSSSDVGSLPTLPAELEAEEATVAPDTCMITVPIDLSTLNTGAMPEVDLSTLNTEGIPSVPSVRRLVSTDELVEMVDMIGKPMLQYALDYYEVDSSIIEAAGEGFSVTNLPQVVPPLFGMLQGDFGAQDIQDFAAALGLEDKVVLLMQNFLTGALTSIGLPQAEAQAAADKLDTTEAWADALNNVRGVITRETGAEQALLSSLGVDPLQDFVLPIVSKGLQKLGMPTHVADSLSTGTIGPCLATADVMGIFRTAFKAVGASDLTGLCDVAAELCINTADFGPKIVAPILKGKLESFGVLPEYSSVIVRNFTSGIDVCSEGGLDNFRDIATAATKIISSGKLDPSVLQELFTAAGLSNAMELVLDAFVKPKLRSLLLKRGVPASVVQALVREVNPQLIPQLFEAFKKLTVGGQGAASFTDINGLADVLNALGEMDFVGNILKAIFEDTLQKYGADPSVAEEFAARIANIQQSQGKVDDVKALLSQALSGSAECRLVESLANVLEVPDALVGQVFGGIIRKTVGKMFGSGRMAEIAEDIAMKIEINWKTIVRSSLCNQLVQGKFSVDTIKDIGALLQTELSSQALSWYLAEGGLSCMGVPSDVLAEISSGSTPDMRALGDRLVMAMTCLAEQEEGAVENALARGGMILAVLTTAFDEAQRQAVMQALVSSQLTKIGVSDSSANAIAAGFDYSPSGALKIFTKLIGMVSNFQMSAEGLLATVGSLCNTQECSDQVTYIWNAPTQLIVSWLQKNGIPSTLTDQVTNVLNDGTKKDQLMGVVDSMLQFRFSSAQFNVVADAFGVSTSEILSHVVKFGLGRVCDIPSSTLSDLEVRTLQISTTQLSKLGSMVMDLVNFDADVEALKNMYSTLTGSTSNSAFESAVLMPCLSGILAKTGVPSTTAAAMTEKYTTLSSMDIPRVKEIIGNLLRGKVDKARLIELAGLFSEELSETSIDDTVMAAQSTLAQGVQVARTAAAKVSQTLTDAGSRRLTGSKMTVCTEIYTGTIPYIGSLSPTPLPAQLTVDSNNFTEWSLITSKASFQLTDPVTMPMEARILASGGSNPRLTLVGQAQVQGEAFQQYAPPEFQPLLAGARAELNAQLDISANASFKTNMKIYVAPRITEGDVTVSGKAAVLSSFSGSVGGNFSFEILAAKGCVNISAPSLGMSAERPVMAVVEKAQTSNGSFALNVRARANVSFDLASIGIVDARVAVKVLWDGASKTLTVDGRTPDEGLVWTVPGIDMDVYVPLRVFYDGGIGFQAFVCTSKTLGFSAISGSSMSADMRLSINKNPGQPVEWSLDGPVSVTLPDAFGEASLQITASNLQPLEIVGGALVDIEFAGVVDPLRVTANCHYNKSHGFSAHVTADLSITPPEWGLCPAQVEVTYDSDGLDYSASLDCDMDVRSLIPSQDVVDYIKIKAVVGRFTPFRLTGDTQIQLPPWMGGHMLNTSVVVTSTGVQMTGILDMDEPAQLVDSIRVKLGNKELNLPNVDLNAVTLVAYAPWGGGSSSDDGGTSASFSIIADANVGIHRLWGLAAFTMDSPCIILKFEDPPTDLFEDILDQVSLDLDVAVPQKVIHCPNTQVMDDISDVLGKLEQSITNLNSLPATTTTTSGNEAGRRLQATEMQLDPTSVIDSIETVAAVAQIDLPPRVLDGMAHASAVIDLIPADIPEKFSFILPIVAESGGNLETLLEVAQIDQRKFDLLISWDSSNQELQVGVELAPITITSSGALQEMVIVPTIMLTMSEDAPFSFFLGAAMDITIRVSSEPNKQLLKFKGEVGVGGARVSGSFELISPTVAPMISKRIALVKTDSQPLTAFVAISATTFTIEVEGGVIMSGDRNIERAEGPDDGNQAVADCNTRIDSCSFITFGMRLVVAPPAAPTQFKFRLRGTVLPAHYLVSAIQGKDLTLSDRTALESFFGTDHMLLGVEMDVGALTGFSYKLQIAASFPPLGIGFLSAVSFVAKFPEPLSMSFEAVLKQGCIGVEAMGGCIGLETRAMDSGATRYDSIVEKFSEAWANTPTGWSEDLLPAGLRDRSEMGPNLAIVMSSQEQSIYGGIDADISIGTFKLATIQAEVAITTQEAQVDLEVDIVGIRFEMGIHVKFQPNLALQRFYMGVDMSGVWQSIKDGARSFLGNTLYGVANTIGVFDVFQFYSASIDLTPDTIQLQFSAKIFNWNIDLDVGIDLDFLRSLVDLDYGRLATLALDWMKDKVANFEPCAECDSDGCQAESEYKIGPVTGWTETVTEKNRQRCGTETRRRSSKCGKNALKCGMKGWKIKHCCWQTAKPEPATCSFEKTLYPPKKRWSTRRRWCRTKFPICVPRKREAPCR